MIRAKILLLSLCTMGILAAIVGLAEMWLHLFDWDIFLKIMGTILMLGTEISFLMAVDYDLPASRRKWLMIGIVILTSIAAILITTQIWTQIFGWDLFLKLMATMGIGVALVGFLLAVAEDFGNNKRLKDQNYVD